jgi:hypothetical protein
LENPILITANFKVLKAAPPILGMRPCKRIGGEKSKMHLAEQNGFG